MYYTVEQLNNPQKNQDTSRTRKYYYDRLKRLNMMMINTHIVREIIKQQF